MGTKRGSSPSPSVFLDFGAWCRRMAYAADEASVMTSPIAGIAMHGVSAEWLLGLLSFFDHPRVEERHHVLDEGVLTAAVSRSE